MPARPERPGAVPILDLSPEIDLVADEVLARIEDVVRSGRFVGGPEVEAFEREAAAYLGVEHAVGVNSGTDALIIALRSLGIGAGDEVITTPFSFFATAEAIANVGASPVFADVEEHSLNIDPAAVEAAVGPRTRAIVPVHLFGLPANMDAIRGVADRHGLYVVEDCAQSFGARHGSGALTGSIGQVGAFSFFPSKNLGAFGDGGLLTTDHAALADTARMLREHGSKQRYRNETLGYNSRLDAIQAAVLRVKLRRVDEWNRGRREAAARYVELLDGVQGIRLPPVAPGHVYHQFTVRLETGTRDAVSDRLAADGIGTMIYYPVPQDRLPVFAHLGGGCPVSDKAAGEVLSLPIGPMLRDDVIELVAERLIAAVSSA